MTRVAASAEEIYRAIRTQLHHEPYAPSTLYGDGYVAEQIANALVALEPYVQKKLAYDFWERGPSVAVACETKPWS